MEAIECLDDVAESWVFSHRLILRVLLGMSCQAGIRTLSGQNGSDPNSLACMRDRGYGRADRRPADGI